MPSREVTASVEDYLKAIYAIQEGHDAASSGALAARMGVGPASATNMMRRLAARGLLNVAPYHGAHLTAEGRRIALRTMRRHRVLECYLATALEYPLDRVHAEAERLEHAVSDALIEHMAAALGNPVVDPHGAPIPSLDGSIDEAVHHSLLEAPIGEDLRVIRLRAEDAAMLRYMEELGIRPGAEVAVAGRAPFEGPISILVEGVSLMIGPAIAARVHVAVAGVKDPDARRVLGKRRRGLSQG